MIDEGLFWNTTIEELSQGYIYENTSDEYVCLICGQRFENGVIYPSEDIYTKLKKQLKSI